MTEDEAKAWLLERYGRQAYDRVAAFLGIVVQENARQNLISPATIANIWSRHAMDSAQLVDLAPADWRTWLDIGSGGGFPGLVVALLAPDRRVILVEPRRKRATFLQDVVDRFALTHVEVIGAKVETLAEAADVISARAVASVRNLLPAAAACATERSTWLLPRGRSGREELAEAGSMFHVEQSLTDPRSVIGVLRGRGT